VLDKCLDGKRSSSPAYAIAEVHGLGRVDHADDLRIPLEALRADCERL